MTRLGLCCAQPWYRHGPIEIVGPPDGIATGKFDVLLLYCSRRQRLSCTLTFVLYLFVFHLLFCIACQTTGLCSKPRSISCIGWFRLQLQWKLPLGYDGTGYRAILVHDRRFTITFDNLGTSSYGPQNMCQNVLANPMPFVNEDLVELPQRWHFLKLNKKFRGPSSAIHHR